MILICNFFSRCANRSFCHFHFCIHGSKWSLKFNFFQLFLDFTMCNEIKVINLFKLPSTVPFQLLKTSKNPKTKKNYIFANNYIWAFLLYSALQTRRGVVANLTLHYTDLMWSQVQHFKYYATVASLFHITILSNTTPYITAIT